MKKITISAFFILLAVLLVGCDDKKKEWDYLYGYTKDDIIGEYSFSNIDKVFEDLEPSSYCHICDDAEISITAASATTVNFNINCPSDNYSRTFTGVPTKNPGDNMVRMSSGYILSGGGRLRAYNVLASVYCNDARNIRLSGFATLNTYKLVPVPNTDPVLYDTVSDSGVNYYFDVIKN